MWIYVAILIQLGMYKVHATNVVFQDQLSCIEFQQFDQYRLRSTAPSPDHRVISMCVQLPQEI